MEIATLCSSERELRNQMSECRAGGPSATEQKPSRRKDFAQAAAQVCSCVALMTLTVDEPHTAEG